MTANKKYPLISIIVPTFERSALLPRALKSIFSQTWKHIEVVVVDDNIPGSRWEKDTCQGLAPYMNRENFLYLKTTGKTGGGAARNFAIRQCHGEYVAFLDDDDRYLPEKLEKQVCFMMENELDGSYHDVIWHNMQERLVEYRSMDLTKDYSTESLLRTHILHSIAPTSIYMFRRDKLMTTEGFGEVPSGQDFILMLRCIEKNMKIRYLKGAYVVQYLHDGTRISLGDNKVKGENMLFELKHKYFSLLTRQERVYVKFRHYAVLSFASMRSKRWGMAMKYAVWTIAVSPFYCAKEAIRYFGSKFVKQDCQKNKY